MTRYIFLLLLALPCAAQETNIVPPAVIGPVSIKTDTESISSIDWSNAGQGVTFAYRQDIPKLSGGSESFWIRPYPHGLSLEYAGLVEWMAEGYSLRYNFRYAHLLPKTYGNGAALYVGDRLDTSGLLIQPTGTLRVDENNAYVTDPETGQPYLDNKAVEFVARTWRGGHMGGFEAGDIRFIVRGFTKKFEFLAGPNGAETSYAEIGPQGLIVGGVNYTTLIASLKSRLDALEQSNNVGP